MTRKIVRTILALVSVATLYMSWAPEASAQTCSGATVAGAWAATLTGTIILSTGPVPAAAVLRYNIDAAGNASGTEWRNVGGEFVIETIKGVGTVSPNCTGTITANIYQSGVLVRTVVLTVVYDDLSTQVRMVQKSLTLPDGTKIPVVITVEGKKLGGD